MRESPFGDLDLGMLAEAVRGPGMDTRIWVSYGIVNQETADQHSVEFDPEWGPLVWVVLQPYDQLVACRVASGVAGNGEGEWHPFLQADEVIVVVPEGDTRSFPVIIGRLNNSFDKFPASVAGQDATKNNFGFIRRSGPFLIEGSDAVLLRSSVTGAMMGIDAKGNITISCGEKNVLQFGPNGVAIQDKDEHSQIFLDTDAGRVGMYYDNTTLQMNGVDTMSTSQGKFVMNCAGQMGVLHGTSAESLVLFLFNALVLMGALLVPPKTPADIELLLTAAITTTVSAGYVGPAAGLLVALQAAFTLALPVTPNTPGIGSSGFYMA